MASLGVLGAPCKNGSPKDVKSGVFSTPGAEGLAANGAKGSAISGGATTGAVCSVVMNGVAVVSGSGSGSGSSSGSG